MYKINSKRKISSRICYADVTIVIINITLYTNDNLLIIRFPLIMNAIQFWLTDTILKMQEITSTKDIESKNTSFMIHPHQPLLSTPTSLENNNSYFSTPMFAVLVEQSERTPLLFPPSKHRMSS